MVPHLMVDAAGNQNVAYDLTGGWLVLDTDPIPGIGWLRKQIGKPKFEDFTMNLIPGSPGGGLSFVTQSCGANAPQLFAFNLTSPIGDGQGVLRACDGWTLSEFTVPACDASGKDPSFFTLKLTGGRAAATATVLFNPKEYSISRVKQIMWLCSNFRLQISDADCSRVNKIESFSIKQAIADVDGDGLPDIMLTGSNLNISLPLADAAPFLAELAAGGKGTAPRTGELDLLDGQGNVMNAMSFSGMHAVGAAPDLNARTSAHATEKIEILYERMELK